MRSNKIFMAIATGKRQEENSFKLYEGITNIKVVAVNPKKAELEKLTGRELETEPVYTSKVDRDGTSVDSVRLTFYVQQETEDTSISQLTFFLENAHRYNTDKTKVQVIDKYGRTAWVTIEECNNHIIPMYSNGPAKLDAGYRPLYRGEEQLIGFLRTLINIPRIDQYNRTNGTWKTHNCPADCEISLDNIKNYFSGDITEIKDAIKFQPDNAVGAMFYVRTTNEGKQYQAIFNEAFVSPFRKIEDKAAVLKKAIEDRQAAGAYQGQVFYYGGIKEYNTTPTDFTKQQPTEVTFNPDTEELPF